MIRIPCSIALEETPHREALDQFYKSLRKLAFHKFGNDLYGVECQAPEKASHVDAFLGTIPNGAELGWAMQNPTGYLLTTEIVEGQPKHKIVSAGEILATALKGVLTIFQSPSK